jgi:hypothetical protein
VRGVYAHLSESSVSSLPGAEQKHSLILGELMATRGLSSEHRGRGHDETVADCPVVHGRRRGWELGRPLLPSLSSWKGALCHGINQLPDTVVTAGLTVIQGNAHSAKQY